MAPASEPGSGGGAGAYSHAWHGAVARTLCLSGVVYIGLAALVSAATIVTAREPLHLWRMWTLLACQVVLIVGLMVLSGRGDATGTSIPLVVGLLVVATVGMVAAEAAYRAGLLDQHAILTRLVPVLALQCLQVIAVIVVRSMAVGMAIASGAVALSWLLDGPENFMAEPWVLYPALIATGVVLGSSVIMNALRNGAERAGQAAWERAKTQSEVTTLSNARFADDEGRRVLHDEVIGALRVVENGSDSQAAIAAASALESLTQLDPVTTVGGLAVDLADANHATAHVTTDAWRVAPPPRVVTAMREAAQEAIRNAVRHGCVTEVQVHLYSTRAGQAVVDVRDEGVGFSPDTASGFGITESIVGRMRQVGGAVQIRSEPGTGTDVKIIWPTVPQPSAQQPATALIPTDQARLYMWASTPVILIGLFAAFRGLVNTPMLGIGLVLAFVLAADAYALAHAVGQRRPSWLTIGAVTLFNAAIAFTVTTYGAPDGFQARAAWIVGMATLLNILLALGASPRQGLVLGLGQLTIIAIYLFTAGRAGVQHPIGPILTALGSVGAGYVFGFLIRAESQAGAVEAAVDLARTEDGRWLESVVDARHRYAGQLRDDVEPFLRDIATNAPVLTPETRLMASVLAAQCRDLLSQRRPIPPDVRQTVLNARLRGVKVSIRDANKTRKAAWQALRVILEECPSAEAVTLIPGQSDGPPRISVLPALSPDDVKRVEAALPGSTLVPTTSAVSTAIDIIPAGGAVQVNLAR